MEWVQFRVTTVFNPSAAEELKKEVYSHQNVTRFKQLLYSVTLSNYILSVNDTRVLLSINDATFIIGNTQCSFRRQDKMSHSCGSKYILTGASRVSYGSSERIPEACLKVTSPRAPEPMTSNFCSTPAPTVLRQCWQLLKRSHNLTHLCPHIFTSLVHWHPLFIPF